MGMKKLTRKHYTVGWISPLEVEQTAALLMVDEEHESLPQSPTDPTVYCLGSIEGHNVVIAGLPSTGNTSAAIVVTHMRRTFPNLRFGLLVGIGGGVPTETDEGRIRLGDVIVSKPAGIHSGAVQYDHGKAEAGQFVRTGALAPPPSALLNAAQMLAAKRATLEMDPIKEHLKRIDATRPQRRRYRYPGIGQDVLHSPACVSKSLASLSLDGGCSCNSQPHEDVSDRDQSKEDSFIMIHRGTIASGEMVIKNGLLRDYLARQHDVLCFETEAAGALNDFPCLVIRGVSDYCDSHKNNLWHGYAAAVAAAYARELFFYMPMNIATPSPKLVRSPHEFASLRSKASGQPDLSNVANWLSSVDFSLMHNDICCRRQQGTGNWLVDSREFQSWMSPAQHLLFCSGMPGAGKTFLASLVVDYLTEELAACGDVAVAYIYCDYKIQEDQRAGPLLSNLLKQVILQLDGYIPMDIENLYLKCVGRKLLPTTHEVLHALTQVLKLFRCTFLIVDGLDEQTVLERRGFLHYILQLQGSTPVKIFATSRPIPEIQQEFVSRDSAQVEIWASNHDIEVYLQANIHKLPSWVQKVPGLLEETIQSITDAAQGMFLLVYLLLESILYKTTLKTFKAALADLPNGINAAYGQIKTRIDRQNTEHQALARSALEWITYTKRSITVKELCAALAVGVGPGAPEADDLPDIDTVISVCCGLIEVNHRAQAVRFVHYTAKQYFEGSLAGTEAHEEIATICLAYLSLDVFASAACVSDEEFEDRLRLYPLYRYASQAWGYHARGESKDLVRIILLFLEKEGNVDSASQALHASQLWIDDVGYSQRVPRHFGAVHIVSYFGLIQVASKLMELSYDFGARDSDFKTPLAWAAESGSYRVVESILSRGDGTLSGRDRIGRSPLIFAARNGHAQVVHLLLNQDPTETDLPDYFGRTPLWHAADMGHLSIVETLLANGTVDLNARNLDGETPLIQSCLKGHTSIVKRLMESGADPKAVDKRYGRPGFIWAAIEGHVDIIAQFIGLDGIDWSTVDRDGRSAVWWAVEEGHESTVRKLLSSSVKSNMNQLDSLSQRTMLSRAAEKGATSIVQLLLEAEGTEPDYRDPDGLVPLAWAARGGHNEVILLLLKTGKVNIDSRIFERLSWATLHWEYDGPSPFEPSRRRGQTPLSHAAEMGFQKSVELLLNHEASIDIIDSLQKTPLIYAIENGHREILTILLERGADPNYSNDTGETPLIRAVQSEKIEMVRRLLAHPDIDESWAGESGHSAIWWAVFNDDTDMLELLSESGRVQRNIRDDFTLLPMAARIGNESAVRWLLRAENAIDPDKGDPCDGRTPLCCAAQGGHLGTMKLLLSTGRVDPHKKNLQGRSVLSLASTAETALLVMNTGVDHNDQDSKGRTPLSYAVQDRHMGKVKILLGHPRIDVNAADRNGNTPLFYVGDDEENMTELLISHGADRHTGNCDGRTPIFTPSIRNNAHLIGLPRSHGLTMDKKDRFGMTPVSDPPQSERNANKLLYRGDPYRYQQVPDDSQPLSDLNNVLSMGNPNKSAPTSPAGLPEPDIDDPFGFSDHDAGVELQPEGPPEDILAWFSHTEGPEHSGLPGPPLHSVGVSQKRLPGYIHGRWDNSIKSPWLSDVEYAHLRKFRRQFLSEPRPILRPAQ